MSDVSELADMALCRFSRSEILKAHILSACPLTLTSSQHQQCPCKRRRYHVTQYDLRVIECRYPRMWNGVKVEDPGALRERITRKDKGTMTTAVAEQQTQAPARSRDIWCGIKVPVLGVAGEKGGGKTLFISSIDPERTAMIDLEDSSASYNIPFAHRWSLYDEMLKELGRVPKPLECFLWFRNLIENGIKPDQYTVLAVDPITDIEQGMVDWVRENPEHFGHTKNQYDKAAGIMWGDVKAYWKLLLGIVSTKVETFAFTAHMGAVWKGERPVEGKRKPKGKETLFELASLYLQVERLPDEKGKVSDKPAARVLKSRLALTTIQGGEIAHTPILPPYLKIATPASIRQYIQKPPDYAKLKSSELAPPEKLSDDDKLLIEAEIADNKRASEEAQLSRMEMMKRAAEQQAEQQRVKHGLSDAKELLTGVAEAGDNAEKDRLVGEIRAMFSQLNLTGQQMQSILSKRGVVKVDELTLEQAKELRDKLWEKANPGN